MYLSKSNLTSWCLPVAVTVYLRYFFPLMVLLHVLSPSLYLLHCDIHGKAGSHWEAHKRRLRRRKCPPRTKANAMCLDDMLLTGFNIEACRLHLLHWAYLWLDKTVTVVVAFLASLALLKIVWVLVLTTKTKQKLQRWGKCFSETRNAPWLIGLIINTETRFMTRHAIGSPVKNTKPDCPEYVIIDNLSQARKTTFSLFPSRYFASTVLNGQEPTNVLVRTSSLILYRAEVWFWLDIRENAPQNFLTETN